jgi:trans-aconitate 2-methyltransferase
MATPDTWRGDDYARHSSLQAAMADEVLSLLGLRGDEQVLDVGCGDGKLTARVAALLPRGSVLGVDASPDMVDHARRQFGPPAHANLRFEVADARSLGLGPQFDLVLSFNTLHWVPTAEQQLQALAGIRDALKPQGQARLRLVTRGELASLEETAEAVRREPPWAAAFNDFSDPYLRLDAQAYAALAAQAGLRVEGVQSALKRWDFGSDEAFFGFCHAGFGAWTRCLPPEQQDDFVRAVMQRYEALIAERFGERHTFRFVQTDLQLARP